METWNITLKPGKEYTLGDCDKLWSFSLFFQLTEICLPEGLLWPLKPWHENRSVNTETFPVQKFLYQLNVWSQTFRLWIFPPISLVRLTLYYSTLWFGGYGVVVARIAMKNYTGPVTLKPLSLGFLGTKEHVKSTNIMMHDVEWCRVYVHQY